SRSTESELAFDFPLTLADLDADPPRLTGEYAQGTAKQRFVYVNSGSMAGQKNTCWTRRAKVPLYGVKRALLAQVVKRRMPTDGPRIAVQHARPFRCSRSG